MNPADATPTPPQIKDIVPPVPYYISGGYLWLIVALGVVLAAALIAWLLLRRKRAPAAPRLTPRQIAAARLEELRRRAPEMDPRVFGVETSDVLREYLGARFGLQPQRQTSPEFLAAIAGSKQFTAAEHGLLSEFLEQCDLLKFARHDASLPAKERLLEQAVNFIEGVETPPPLPAPPAPA